MEVVNMDPDVQQFLGRMQALSSPPVLPQLALEIMLNPPAPGDPSNEAYTQVHNRKYSTYQQHLIRFEWRTKLLVLCRNTLI